MRDKLNLNKTNSVGAIEKLEVTANSQTDGNNTLTKQPYPACQWSVSTTKKGVDITVKTTFNKLEDVTVWSANSTDMILQNEKWEGKSLE